MPLTGGTKEYNTFVGGLVTEASSLTFPENASKDEDNFELNRDGSRKRRNGLDYEVNYTLTDLGLTYTTMERASVTAFKWEGAGGDAENVFAVVQVHNLLYFFDLTKSNPSAHKLNYWDNSGTFSTDGMPIPAAYGDISENPISYTPVIGRLMCVSAGTLPFYIEYDRKTGVFSTGRYDLEVRDVWGLDDGYAVDARPSTLTSKHQYNLYNQGWNFSELSSLGSGVYPSNSDVMSFGKNASEVFTASLLLGQYFGNTPAPKGRFIISAFTRGLARQNKSGVGQVFEQELGRPVVTSTYASRVFYSGVSSNVANGDSKAPDYTGFVFFSRVVTNIADAFKCYQEADPTSEHVSDLIDSDGGFIVIPEADQILGLEVIGNSLVVIAANGAWEVYGDTGGFTATSFQVSKITNVGCIGAGTIVNAENNVMYWSKGGIYNLAFESVSGRVQATNISEKTIQTYFNNIGQIAGEHARGAYDPANRKVTWVYNGDSTFDGSSYEYRANKALVLDVALTSFYPRTIVSLDVESPFIANCIVSPGFNTTTHPYNVAVNNEEVQVNGETVNTYSPVTSSVLSSLKHVVIKPSAAGNYQLTFGDYNNTLFREWQQDDTVGKDAPAYMETGTELFGDTQRQKQVPYLTMHFRRSERGARTDDDGNLEADMPSSCQTQARWDFSDSSSSGKYGTTFEAYRLLRPYKITGLSDNFDYGQDTITTKNKLRGRGRALSLRMDTQPDHDLHVLGWGLNVTTGTAV